MSCTGSSWVFTRTTADAVYVAGLKARYIAPSPSTPAMIPSARNLRRQMPPSSSSIDSDFSFPFIASPRYPAAVELPRDAGRKNVVVDGGHGLGEVALRLVLQRQAPGEARREARCEQV